MILLIADSAALFAGIAALRRRLRGEVERIIYDEATPAIHPLDLS